MRLGLIARCDNTGLGNLTLELTKMLNPDKIMLIDSSPFNAGQKQFPERYEGRNVVMNKGFLSTRTVIDFIKDVDVIFSCEIFYNNSFVNIARLHGKKTVLQYMYEFLEYLTEPDRQLPDVLVGPSSWNFDKVEKLFGEKSKVVFLPPPTEVSRFEDVRKQNMERSNRLLHIAGKAAIHDRNGTRSVIDMLKYSSADYELVIRTQTGVDIPCNDPRLVIETKNIESNVDMYRGFDAMIIPRRYAGLCLPMNESLVSGLPVFMTDVSPNNDILPKRWLAKSSSIGQFKARDLLDIYNADPRALAEIVDSYFNGSDMESEKDVAYSIGYNTFSPDVLKDKYVSLIDSL